MRKTGLLALTVALCTSFLTAPPAQAGKPPSGTATVCASGCPFTSIQAAIDAAAAGSTITVADGIYRELITFGTKPVVVKSINGRDKTTIDGGAAGTVATFTSNTGTQSRLEGFTVANGYSDGGPGGLMISQAAPTIVGCSFTANTGFWGGAAQIYWNANPAFTDCLFTNNVSNDFGGGIMAGENSNPTFERCVFTGNSAQYGAAIHTYRASHPVFTNCLITGNRSYQTRSGAVFSGYLMYSAASFVNCTIAGNIGPGAYIEYSSTIDFTNCILWGNDYDLWVSEDTRFAPQVRLNSSDIGVFLGPGITLDGGCFQEDPKFDTVRGDYSLLAGSRCIDGGTAVGAPPVDLLGVARPQGPAFDIGAYEYRGSTVTIGKALYDYVADTLTVEATSPNGASAALSLSGFGPMTWDRRLLLWKTSVQTATAPAGVTVCGPLDGCQTQR